MQMRGCHQYIGLLFVHLLSCFITLPGAVP
jgi:hypothetical protein